MIIDTIVDAAQVTTTVTNIPISAADTMVTTTPIIEATKTTVEVPQVPKEEDRLEIEKAQQKLEANEALINTFDDIQARIDADAQLA
nr:hypothetical protein [Tanacetum cinerariifolium]